MTLAVGGQPLVTLTAPDPAPGAGGFIRAVIAPGRAMMLLTLTAKQADGREVEVIDCPPLQDVARRLNDRPADVFGNAAFAFGGAILAPFANRIRGRADGEAILVDIEGRQVRLPANWSGKAPDAERYAMHGLMLAAAAHTVETGGGSTMGRVILDNPARWPSRLEMEISWALRSASLDLEVRARNGGAEATPVGIGWHPYFTVPSGRREQARLTVPATARALVADYDSVLPTGEIAPVTGTDYDFASPAGRALGRQHLDDCFVGLIRNAGGEVAVRLVDPAFDYAVTVATRTPQVRAFQIYAPTDRPIAAIEPQFNLADPFGEVWGGADTGMVWLRPGEATAYAVQVLPA